MIQLNLSKTTFLRWSPDVRRSALLYEFTVCSSYSVPAWLLPPLPTNTSTHSWLLVAVPCLPVGGASTVQYCGPGLQDRSDRLLVITREGTTTASRQCASTHTGKRQCAKHLSVRRQHASTPISKKTVCQHIYQQEDSILAHIPASIQHSSTHTSI